MLMMFRDCNHIERGWCASDEEDFEHFTRVYADLQKLVHLVTGYYLSLGKISEVVVLISNRLVKLVTHLCYYFDQ